MKTDALADDSAGWRRGCFGWPFIRSDELVVGPREIVVEQLRQKNVSIARKMNHSWLRQTLFIPGGHRTIAAHRAAGAPEGGAFLESCLSLSFDENWPSP